MILPRFFAPGDSTPTLPPADVAAAAGRRDTPTRVDKRTRTKHAQTRSPKANNNAQLQREEHQPGMPVVNVSKSCQ